MTGTSLPAPVFERRTRHLPRPASTSPTLSATASPMRSPVVPSIHTSGPHSSAASARARSCFTVRKTGSRVALRGTVTPAHGLRGNRPAETSMLRAPRSAASAFTLDSAEAGTWTHCPSSFRRTFIPASQSETCQDSILPGGVSAQRSRACPAPVRTPL